MSEDEDDDSRPYEVGYGKPPRKSQFKPGQSGNPKGRTKKPRPKTVNAVMGTMLHEPITLPDGRRKTRFELIMMRMLKDVAEGKVKQWMPVITFLERFDPKVEFVPTDEDAANLAEMLARLQPKLPENAE